MSTLPPPIPPRPDLGEWSPAWIPRAPEPAGRRRFPVWVVASALLTLFFMAMAGLVSFATRYDPAEHADEYEFLARDFRGDPIRWNPCEPIHYVVNLNLAPEGSMQDVHEAVRRISMATGIEFDYDGLSSESPMRRRPVYQPERYGDRWAPVLIAWVDPDTSDISFAREGHTAAGVAAPSTASSDGDVLVSGWIAINLEDPNPPGFELVGAQGPVVLHELGHIVGLDHAKNFGQIMESSGGGMTDLGPGDLAGLERLGRPAGCLTTPDTPG